MRRKTVQGNKVEQAFAEAEGRFLLVTGGNFKIQSVLLETVERNDNHSIAYCLIGYICAWLRCYHPYEFITSYLNNAANDDDIKSGTKLAKEYGISITPPRFGVSTDEYMFDERQHVISKGVSSVKFLSKNVSRELYDTYHRHGFESFMQVLAAIDKETSCDDRQIKNLIRVDYFKEFGNVAELLKIYDVYCYFKRGAAKTINKQKLTDGPLKTIIERHATDIGVKGNRLKTYTITDMPGLLGECEQYLRSLDIPDRRIRDKINDQLQLLGYIDIVTGNPSDRKKLIILDTFELKGKGGEVWGVALNVRSVGTGNEARLTVRYDLFKKNPLKKMDVILCQGLYKNQQGYWYLNAYEIIVS